MNWIITFKRPLLFLVCLILSSALYSAQPKSVLTQRNKPERSSFFSLFPERKKPFFLNAGKMKLAVKHYSFFYKKLKKKYGRSMVGSTILIAVLALAALLLVLLLITQAGVSGFLLTAVGVIGFIAILFWAIRRIRRNAEY